MSSQGLSRHNLSTFLLDVWEYEVFRVCFHLMQPSGTLSSSSEDSGKLMRFQAPRQVYIHGQLQETRLQPKCGTMCITETMCELTISICNLKTSLRIWPRMYQNQKISKSPVWQQWISIAFNRNWNFKDNKSYWWHLYKIYKTRQCILVLSYVTYFNCQ